MNRSEKSISSDLASLFAADTPVGALLRSRDWRNHPLGQTQGWPTALKNTLNVLFHSPSPMCVFWGSEFYCFFNDSFLSRHGPAVSAVAMGQGGDPCSLEFWQILKPKLEMIMNDKAAAFIENHPGSSLYNVKINRETWSYDCLSVLKDAATVGGFLVTCTERLDGRHYKDKLLQIESWEHLTRNRLQSFFMKAPFPLAFLEGPEHRLKFANHSFEEFFCLGDYLGEIIGDLIPQLKTQGIVDLLDQVFTTGELIVCNESQLDIQNVDGTLKKNYLNFFCEPVRGGTGRVEGILLAISDITNHILSRNVARLQKEAMELTLNNSPLETVLEMLAIKIEDQLESGTMASILLMDPDGQCLIHGAAPSLPDEYNMAINGFKIGPDMGSCGTAAYLGKTVIVSDIASDPLWKNFNKIALKHKLRSCWSTPIVSSSGKVLGTFALYRKDVFRPSKIDQQLVDLATQTAAIILERQIEVNQRLHAENALLESQERLDLALKSSNIGFWDWNARTGYVYLSDSLMKDWGIDPANFKHTLEECLDCIHEDDRGFVWKNIQSSTFDNKPYDVEYRVIRPGGELIWVNAKGRLFLNEVSEPERLTGVTINITAQVRARKKIESSEARIRAEEAKLKAIFYGTDSPMVLFRGPDLVYEMINGKYQQLIPGREVLGKPLNVALPEIADSPFPKAIKKVFDTGEPCSISEGMAPLLNTSTKEIEHRYFDTTFARISDDPHKPFLVIGHSMDVTDRVRARKKIEESEEKTRAAKVEAQRANELKSAFLANMSHEIRTPLSAILGFTDIIKTLSSKDSKLQSYLEIIEKNGHSLIKIIDDILDLSKIEADKLEIEHCPLSLIKVINEVIEMFSDQALEKGLILQFDDTGIPKFEINSDAIRIRQVLVNLVGNALKFTTVGTVKIYGNHEVLDNDSVKIVILVADTGIGLTPDQASRLFKPFMQGDNKSTRKFGGTGLGLALSKKLGTSLGGDVTLESFEKDHGATFKLEFTATSTPVDKTKTLDVFAESTLPTNNRLPHTKVLVVDDSSDNRALIEIILQREGATVHQAAEGEEAVNMALRNSYDVILMDIQMPGIDGYEALAQLRDQDYQEPVFALTAHAMIEEQRRALAAGFNEHIPKPVNSNDLIEAILTHVKHSART